MIESKEALDPRSVANTVIRIAEEFDLTLTHLSLQKILYFVHGLYLIKKGKPLVSGYFEAWQYGPVHPLIYATFKEHGSSRLREKVGSKDMMTGVYREVPEPDDAETRLFVTRQALTFLQMSPRRLVDLSHAKNSPWDVLTRNDAGSRVYGMRITAAHITSTFKHHKMTIENYPDAGEPNDESPPS